MVGNLIQSTPEVMLGKLVIAGTRITVEFILEELSGGATVEEILASHPHLTRQGVRAALEYAVGVLRSDIPLPAPPATHELVR